MLVISYPVSEKVSSGIVILIGYMHLIGPNEVFDPKQPTKNQITCVHIDSGWFSGIKSCRVRIVVSILKKQGPMQHKVMSYQKSRESRTKEWAIYKLWYSKALSWFYLLLLIPNITLPDPFISSNVGLETYC